MRKKLLLIMLSVVLTLGSAAFVYADDAVYARDGSAAITLDSSATGIVGAATKIGSVKLQYTSKAYTGKALKPSVKVTAKVSGKTKTLKKGTDYTVSYSKNTNVGTATVTVKGKGKFKGTIKKTFKITAVTLSSATLKYTSAAYAGKALKPTATVKAKVNGSTKTLKSSTDYTISYKNNTNAGTATVTIKGKGNYKGTLTKTFKITAVSLSSATLEYAEAEYTGEALEPAVTVKAKVDGSTKTLKKGTDYTVSYSNNAEIGTAAVVIKGKGNFKGTIEKTFEIVEPYGTPFVDPLTEWSVYDSLIGQIRVETEKSRRAELMHQAEDILMATNAVIPIYYYNDLYMQKSDVTGIYATPYGMKYFMDAQIEGGTDTLRAFLGTEPTVWYPYDEDPSSSLDPALNSAVDGACLAVNSFAGLYTCGPSGVTEPDCAEFYTVSDDGKTYTVFLKEGLKWSDGSALTAYDFVYSWKRTSDPDTGADYGYLFELFDGYGSEQGINVTALNDTTLEFVLTAPCAYIEELMAFPAFFPLPQAFVEANSTPDRPGAWAADAGFPSNGPFVCTAWNHDQFLTYERNPYYWKNENGAFSMIEKLEFLLSDDGVEEAYMSGELDFINMATETLINAAPLELHNNDELGTYYIAFNVKSALFEEKTPEQAAAMREAVSLLIDRDYIVNSILGNGQKPASTFVPVGMSDGNGGIFHADNLDGYYDPYAINDNPEGTLEKARQLLKTAGFVFDENGMLSEETPFEFEYCYNAGHGVIAESIRADLSVLGISMTLQELSWSDFQTRRGSGEFDLTRGGWIADFNDPINMLELFTTDSGNNDPQFGR